MRILYAVQGTGNGHIAVARDLIPRLKQQAEVDILVSGTHVEITLPFEIKYRLHGLCFMFGKKGGIDYPKTYKENKLRRFFKEIKELPMEEYDLVISDFEPVSAWASHLRNVPCIGIGHQNAVIHPAAPKPEHLDIIGQAVLKYYAPASVKLGFHYLRYDTSIFTPLIRKEVRELATSKQGHYSVYLPAYSDKRIVRLLSALPEVKWIVFSKHTQEDYETRNISVRKIDNEAFLGSMASADGVLCGSGFQTPAEVLFLKKKLIVVPMKGQYEQQCNAAALRMLGVPVLKNLKLKRADKLREWVTSEQKVDVYFPDNADNVVVHILNLSLKGREAEPGKPVKKFSQFQRLLFDKIFYHSTKLK